MNATVQQVIKQRTDIHQRAQKLKNIQERIKEDKSLIEANKQLLISYDEKLQKDFLKKKLSASGWEKSLSEAYSFVKIIKKDVKKLDKLDIKAWYDEKEDKFIRGELSGWTLHKYHSQVRKFLNFVFDTEGRPLEMFDWIKKELPDKPRNDLLPTQLPSQEQVKDYLVALRNQGHKNAVRNTGIIALCNDVGCRIEEALSIKNENIVQEKNYLVVTLPQSKTRPRTVISFLAKPYLMEWEALSPNRGKPDAHFFCDGQGKPVKYHALRKSMLEAAATCGLKFPKNKMTHLFRNVFASRSFNWPEIPRRTWMGWSGGISDTYTHINHKQCAEHYFRMLEGEKNPMYNEKPRWRTESMNEEEKELHRKMIIDVLRGEFGSFDKKFEEKIQARV